MYSITRYSSDNNVPPPNRGGFGLIGGIIAFIFGFVLVMLGLRFIFLLFGANPATPFVRWIYSTSSPFIAPFNGIFGHATVAPAGTVVHSVFDPSTLIALAVYGIVGVILLSIFGRRTYL